MKPRPHILITNDDGIHAPGIRHLWGALKDKATVTIVAPSSEQSAVGLGITLRNPLRIEKNDRFETDQAWSITGTPADCVKMALSVIMESPPDLVVSGINRGTNAGKNLLYSGTVAGAIEGIMHDIPSIAFSCCDFHNPNYSLTKSYIPLILDYVMKHPLPPGTLLNVNFPKETIKGLKLTRQGKEFWIENPDKRPHPHENHSYYWLGAKLCQYEEEEDCDISWLRQGYIAAVPIHVGELTDHSHLNEGRIHFDQHCAPHLQ